jgi:hypothetical protein
MISNFVKTVIVYVDWMVHGANIRPRNTRANLLNYDLMNYLDYHPCIFIMHQIQ